jgi:polyhydroxybutyrate depolymerase
MSRTHRFAAALLILLWASPVVGQSPLAPGDRTRTLKFGGADRSYLVHVPPRYDAGKPTPLVLVFHGALINGPIMVHFCGLNATADKEGFITVYPNGTGLWETFLTWNGGNCCGPAQWKQADDVGFTRAVLDDVAKLVNVDTRRIYATGLSNGGIMCYRLASELSDRIAAIAPVAGTMGTPNCHPKRPVSVMHFHGDEDHILPFNGGLGRQKWMRIVFASVDDSIRAWVKADGCPPKPTVTQLPAKVDDGTTVERKAYGPGKGGTEVVLYTIHGGGHTWPGEEPTVEFLGKSTKNISANDLMWAFFKRHPLAAPEATRMAIVPGH